MQVLDEIRKSVVFLAYNTKSETKLAGTAFLVSCPIPEVENRVVLYLVTARHCIEEALRRSIDNQILVRFNVVNDIATIQPVPQNGWYFPDNPSIDVAVCPIGGPPFSNKVFDFRHLPVATFATQEVMKADEVGIGDEVFAVGLFTQHIGRGKNIPILRAGNIAAMPEEPVRTERGRMDAYLIELRSIGGLSGSPVFVYLAGPRMTANGNTLLGGMSRYRLLGLMHGHWNFPADGDAPLQVDGVFDNEKLNVGIGVVVPADEIVNLLNRDDIAGQRNALAKSSSATDSSTASTPNPLHSPAPLPPPPAQ